MSLCNRDCNKCNLFIYCQGCSLCEKAFCQKDCNNCFALCPDRPGSFSYLKKLGGAKLKLSPNKYYNLPANIPVIPDRLTEPMNVREVIALHGAKMLTSNGERLAKVYIDRGVKGALNLKNNVKTVIEFYVKDRVLEGFWDNRSSLYNQIYNLNPYVVITPNYSVYEDAPRIDHLYNMKRSNIVYNEMIALGLPAVPDISWYNRFDLDQWIKAINGKHIKCISFSFQTVDVRSKASNSYLHYLIGYQYLVKRIPEDIEIILAGIVSPKKINLLKKISKHKLSVLNQSAYIHSRKGLYSEYRTKAPDSKSKNEILMVNIDYYDRAYEQGDTYAKV